MDCVIDRSAAHAENVWVTTATYFDSFSSLLLNLETNKEQVNKILIMRSSTSSYDMVNSDMNPILTSPSGELLLYLYLYL